MDELQAYLAELEAKIDQLTAEIAADLKRLIELRQPPAVQVQSKYISILV